MTPSETQFFNLLDNYSRARHSCFIAEIFLNDLKTHYVLCIRPSGGNENSPDAYYCKYLKIELAGLGVTAQSQELPISIRAELDNQLQALGKTS